MDMIWKLDYCFEVHFFGTRKRAVGVDEAWESSQRFLFFIFYFFFVGVNRKCCKIGIDDLRSSFAVFASSVDILS